MLINIKTIAKDVREECFVTTFVCWYVARHMTHVATTRIRACTGPGMSEQDKQQVNWMPVPQETVPGCPPGLEYLTQVDQLLVNEQVQLMKGERS